MSLPAGTGWPSSSWCSGEVVGVLEGLGGCGAGGVARLQGGNAGS